MECARHSPLLPLIDRGSLNESVSPITCAVILEQLLPHASPPSEQGMVQDGIFTNYMQFVDDFARNCETIKSTTRGANNAVYGRLRILIDRILTTNPIFSISL